MQLPESPAMPNQSPAPPAVYLMNLSNVLTLQGAIGNIPPRGPKSHSLSEGYFAGVTSHR